jgi:exodeoxyribonuclease VIII
MVEEIEAEIAEVTESALQTLIREIESGDFYLSHSSFNEFCKSPRHFINYKLKASKPTPAMKFGEMVHVAALQLDLFDERFMVAPPCDRRTKEGRAQWEAIAEKAYVTNKEIVTAVEYDGALAIAKAIRLNDTIGATLGLCDEFETPIQWTYGKFNWRGRLDACSRQSGIICDLKILADASPRAVANYIKFEGAGRQAFHYTTGAGFEADYYVVAIDKAGNSSVTIVTRPTLEGIKKDIDWNLQKFRQCVFLNRWNDSFDYFSPDGFFKV